MTVRRSSRSTRLIGSVTGKPVPEYGSGSTWWRIAALAGLLALIVRRLGELLGPGGSSLTFQLEEWFARGVGWLQGWYRGN